MTPWDSGAIATGRGVWVGGAGTLVVDFRNGQSAVRLVGVPAGSLLPIDVSRIYNTDTTASEIVVLF